MTSSTILFVEAIVVSFWMALLVALTLARQAKMRAMVRATLATTAKTKEIDNP